MSYFIEKCIYPDEYLGEKVGYQIRNEEYEMFWVNLWLSRLKEKTARQYGYKVCKFINYINERGLNYLQANEAHLDNFITNTRYKGKNFLFSISENTASYSTIMSYVYAITEFYSFLNKLNKDLDIKVDHIKKKNAKYSFLYQISWNKEQTKLYIDKNLTRYKSKKEFVKWYEDNEINCILSCFNTNRDKAIFRLSLCGMRIDEILSIRMQDYNFKQKCVVAFRSKGKITGETGRCVSLDFETITTIENYLNTERIIIEMDFLNKDNILTETLFVGIKNNKGYGKPLSYRSYLETFKTVAAKAGIERTKARTHSGRSTAVMRDIIFHAKHPLLLSLEDIRIKYGWKNIESIDPYLDTSNPEISKENRLLLDKVKQEQKEILSRRMEKKVEKL